VGVATHIFTSFSAALILLQTKDNLESVKHVKRGTIGYLLLKFKESNAYLKWHKYRVERHQFNSKWINPDSVQSLTDD